MRLCNTQESNIGETTPVNRYSPFGDSVYGARDMAGNVWEWTRSSIGNVQNSISRVMCGGSFGDKSIYARCAFRMEYPIVTSANSFGFRLAITPKSKDVLNEVHFPGCNFMRLFSTASLEENRMSVRHPIFKSTSLISLVPLRPHFLPTS
jgi:hypothetical protein